MGRENESITAIRAVVGLGLSLLIVALLFATGCTAAADSEVATDSVSSVSSETTVASADTTGMDFEYTERDKDASYDESSATTIALAQAGSTVQGQGAAVDGSTVTITEEGTYIVSGSLTDGQLVVETADTSKVQIVLSNATIHNEDGPAVYIKQTDKCFITLAEGTKNSLSDGAEYTLEEGSDEPYATLYSKDDLTINGSGALAVTSAYRHAICSKDDLVITGGTYTIDAAEDALRGRDCVKILAGDFTITAAGDGIKANRSDDATRGFVSIDGGTFEMTVGDDGIQAETLLRVTDGTVSIDATDDAIHSNLEALIAGGSLTITAGDDAVHAETVLTIDDGTINVTSCYEGYEAEKIYINGGETHIVASDDAINAATASAADGATVDTTESAAAGSTSGSTAGEALAAPSGTMPEGEAPSGTLPEGEMLSGAAPSDTAPDGVAPSGEGSNEKQQNGGRPDNAFDEGGMGMGNESCLIQINGGYTCIESGGDSIDSNGNVEITGGVLLVSGPTSGGDGAFDYDLEATVTGGVVLMAGSTGMAQNFTSGEQPFSFNTVSGEAGQSIAVTDGSGNVLASFTSPKQFGMVLVASPSFTEGGSYQLVVGGTVSGANADGYTDSGTVSGGTSTAITASTTATAGMGGLGSDGMGLGAGKGGSPRGGMQQGSASTTTA